MNFNKLTIYFSKHKELQNFVSTSEIVTDKNIRFGGNRDFCPDKFSKKFRENGYQYVLVLINE